MESSKSISVSNLDGEQRMFIIRKIPAIPMKIILDYYCEHSRLSDDELLSLLAQSGVDINEVDDHHQLAQLENEIIEFNIGFFKYRKKIRIPNFKNKFTPQDYPNADPFIAAIISSGMASYKELKESLSLEEAFEIWEVGTTNKINEIKSLEV